MLEKPPTVNISSNLLLLKYHFKMMLSFRKTCTAQGVFFIDKFHSS